MVKWIVFLEKEPSMKLTLPPHKDFKEDIRIIKKSLEDNEYITISKFCDGELAVILNRRINNKEFWFDPSDQTDQQARSLLISSFKYRNPRYYVGITCTNVFGLQTHNLMKLISGQPESNLTWADIWVNSNYQYYVDNIIPIFNKHRVILVCNENGKVDNLPFTPEKIFTVQNNACKYNLTTIEAIKGFISDNDINNRIFLFCCGPFGNILAHRLTEFRDNNTYLDIGSTLNPYLQSEGFKRDYYTGNNAFANMIGGWDNSCKIQQ